jgi:hypothetical protein
MGALVFPSDMEDIGGPSTIRDLATSSNNKLLDPLITQVGSENKPKSDSDGGGGGGDDDNDVIPAYYPPKASTLVQVPATAPTLTIRSSLHRSRKHTRKIESWHIWDIAAVELKEQHRKEESKG